MKLVKNDLYLLLIDEEAEIKFNDLMYDSKLEIVMRYNSYNDGCSKIIAYYPLTKEAKELDLLVLPPFEDLFNVTEWAKEEHKFNHRSIHELSFILGCEVGYEKAQSKSSFTLEDIKKAWDDGFKEGFKNPDNPTTNNERGKFIQSLSTQQLPKEFVGWLSKKKCPYDFTSRCTIDRCDCEFVFETIINSEGKEEIQGTYKY